MKPLALVMLAGLALRVGFCAWTGFNRPPAPGSDQREYDMIAVNLAAGHGYHGISWGNPDEHITAYRAPVLPASWAVLYRVCGHRYDVLRLANIGYGLLTIMLLYGVARECFDEPTALLAAAWLAVYPVAVYWTAELLAETQFLAVQMLFIWLGLRAARQPGWRNFTLAGLAAGVATLSRPNFLLLLPLLPLWSAVVFWGRWRAWASSLLMVVIAGLVIAPWTWRNYRAFGRWIPVTTQSGSNLLMGNNPVVVSEPLHFGKEVYEDRIPGFSEQLVGLPEAERDAKAGQLAAAWLRAHPEHWGFLVWEKFKAFCSPWLRGPDQKARLIMLLSWGPVFVMAAPAFFVTLWRFSKQRHAGLLLHFVIASTLGGILIVFFNARYRFPAEPLCIVLAAAALMWCWQRFVSHGQRKSIAV